jgi:CBS-domain-containing membrane protein
MKLNQALGIQARSSWAEKLISGCGALFAITSVYFLTDWLTEFDIAIALLPSMGATAVLVFAVPHGTLSQPWPVIGGNTISAFIGVVIALTVEPVYLAAGLAVGTSIATMHLLRCIHPPGGATALIPILGGEAIQAMGFEFVAIPTLVNCSVMVVIALLFNNLFYWRRYPASLMKYDHSMYHPETYDISAKHIQQAMETLDEVIDVTPDQIKYIVDKADEIMLESTQPLINIIPGGHYTNGAAGRQWSVRKVIDISNHPNPANKLVMYRTVDGALKGEHGTTRLYEFKWWAKEQMHPSKPVKEKKPPTRKNIGE